MKKLNNKIGDTLKEYRKKNQLTVSEVAVQLNGKYHLNVAEKTIYGWESNQAHPTSDVFLVLCNLYGISDISENFGTDQSRDFPTSMEERELITAFRLQNDPVKLAVRRVLGIPVEE